MNNYQLLLMKFECFVVVHLPINRVVSLWKDERNFKHWQDGFQSIELIEGQKGEVGAKSKILLEEGKRKMELIETVLVNQLPSERKTLVEHMHMDNTQTVRFEAIDGSKTRYISEIEYTQMKHIVPKVLSKLFPSLFKKQVQKWMNQFKAFAELNANNV